MGNALNRREFLQGLVSSAVLLAAPVRLIGLSEQKKTCCLHDDIYLKHITGEQHPEKPYRLIAIEKRLKQSPWYGELLHMPAKRADLDTVALVHKKDYIDLVKRECEAGREMLSTGDTAICEDSYEVALHAAGGIISVVDAVCEGKAKNAFCAVRPPGHHATPDRGMGFCVFNHVAIAARYAQKKHGIGRVLIADWDVHHGNGTQDIFYTDGSVFFMSTHQSPFYPRTGKKEETGEGEGKGLTMNRPFSKGAGNKEIVGAFKNDLLPAAKKFKPELTLISAGFDSRVEDFKGEFKVNDNGFRELTQIMLEIAYIAGEGKLISVLEGGYNPEGMAEGVNVHIDELVKA